MRARVLYAILTLALLAGCSARGPEEQPPTAPPRDAEDAHLVALDGRWSFPERDARELAADALGAAAGEPGSAWRGEALLAASEASLAARVLALDPTAAALLGGLRSPAGEPLALPAPGTAYLTPELARALGVALGDALRWEADAWPESRVTLAFEMENVYPCEEVPEATLCLVAATPEGETELRFRVPPRTAALRFHADVVELGPHDFPAYWNGTFTSPSGRTHAFSTAAFSREHTLPPAELESPIEEGDWVIHYVTDVQGARLTGPPIGFLTYRPPGFAPYDYELLQAEGAAEQTRAALARARAGATTLRVAALVDADGPLRAMGASALLAPEDARVLLGVPAGEVTHLVLPRAPGAHFAELAAQRDDPRVAALQARPLPPPREAVAEEGALLVLRAPASLDLAALPRVEGVGEPALTMELAPREGGMHGLGARAAPPLRILALPAAGPAPWAVAPGGYWGSAEAAREHIGTAPHLVVVSPDLAALAEPEPGGPPYPRLVLDAPAGNVSLYVMGTAEGGPAGAAWGGAPLLVALGAPEGARLVVRAEDPAARDAALLAWRAFGVAPLATP